MNPQESPSKSQGLCRLRALLMVVLGTMTCVLFFARLDLPLLEPEEARYAEIPRQMLVEDRWLIPVLHGENYLQKPPLLYWLVMLSYQLFGVHDWAARLIPCLAGIGSVAVTIAWGWRTLGFWTGFVSGAVLTLSARFLYLAGMLTMDGVLCTCIVAGLAFGHLSLMEPARRRRWVILSAIACSLGILIKGPVAIVLIAVPLCGFALLHRRRVLVTTADCCLYLVIVALLAGPWFVMMACREPEAAGDFWWLHHFRRYFVPFDHEKPVWFYAPSLLLGALPWSLLLVPMAHWLRCRTRSPRPEALGVFLVAFAWCVLFFSLSGCKRQGYILPAFPLLALLIGTFVTHGWPWQRWMDERARGPAWGHRWAQGLTFAGFVMGVTLSQAAGVSELWSWPCAIAASAVLVLLAIAFTRWPTQWPTWTSWSVCPSVVFLMLCLGQRALLPAYHGRFGLRHQAELALQYQQESSLPLVCYPKRWDSISFYLHRNDVATYTSKESLLQDLQKVHRALIFIERKAVRSESLRHLPTGMEIEWCGELDQAVVVGLVTNRHSPCSDTEPRTERKRSKRLVQNGYSAYAPCAALIDECYFFSPMKRASKLSGS